MVLPKEHVKDICKFGQAEKTCRYLSMGPGGLECEKGTSIGTIIDQRSAEGTMKAKGDNYPGVH
jgi:hypothetical protein